MNNALFKSHVIYILMQNNIIKNKLSHCDCNGFPFYICEYCNKKFTNSLIEKNHMFKKIQEKNKAINQCNCFWFYECVKCHNELFEWAKTKT